MIFKEPGNNKIHRLRVVHIYEADFQLITGMKWRALAQNMEHRRLHNPGVCGTRPFLNAHTPAHLEELMLETSRVSRKSAIDSDDDCTSCFVRNIPALVAVQNRGNGMPKKVTQVANTALHEACHWLKTVLGLSPTSCSHSDELPVLGMGQGSGRQSFDWSQICNSLFDVFDRHAHGAFFETPDRTTSVRMFNQGCVDNASKQVNDFRASPQPCMLELAFKMQEDNQLWCDLLNAAGHELELPKCSFHAIEWMFADDGEPCLRPCNDKLIIEIASADRTTSQRSKQLSACSSHKTLGTCKAPIGSQKTQCSALKKKSDDIAMFLRSCPLDRHEAWTHCFACYFSSMTCVLPNTHFLPKELLEMQRKAVRIVVAKCGCNWNTKRDVLFGPHSLGGGGFRSLDVEQGVAQVLQFLRHWQGSGQPQAMSHVTVSWIQFHLSTGVSFLRDVTSKLPHAESKWFMSMHSFLARVNACVDFDNTGVLPLQRDNDQHIVDGFGLRNF